MLHRRALRPVLVAFAAALTSTLGACCSGGWELTEPGGAALLKARPDLQGLTLEYDACALSDSMVHTLERAAIILGDEEKALIDLQARIDVALTDGERQALIAKRDVLLQGMSSQVDQLRSVSSMGPGGTSSIAVVYSAVKVSSMANVPVITAKFDYLSAIGPGETPAGIAIRDVSPRLALATLVDDMERFAQEQGVITVETRARLADQ
jgi:hypothetical protein